MTKEEIIAMLEQHIKMLEFGRNDPLVNTIEEQERYIGSAIDHAKQLLERIKAGDEEAIREISDLLRLS